MRLRRGAKPPFSFSVEKEKALFDGVKRKRLGGGIPGFARNARSACYGGFGLVMAGGLDHSTTYAVSLVGGIQGCTLLLFCCRTLAVAGAWCWGCFGMLPAPLLLPHLGGRRSLVLWVVPDAPCFCFADAVRWVSKERRQALSNCRGAAAKEEGGASGSAHTSGLPQLPGCGSEKRKAEHPGASRTFVGVKG